MSSQTTQEDPATQEDPPTQEEDSQDGERNEDAPMEDSAVREDVVQGTSSAAGPVANDTAPNDECSICFEVLGEAAMHCVGSAGRQHHFHGRCLAAWVEQCRLSSRPPSCPTCRGRVEIHRGRLASEIGEAPPVEEILTLHATQADPEGAPDGWVRVGEECSICYEAVGEADSAMHCVGVGGIQHHFHGRCLTAWVEECRRGSRPPTCPNCRGPVEVHRGRLASEIGAAAPVQEFMTLHATQGHGQDEGEDGWVRVGQPTSILDTLRSNFQSLDAALLARRQSRPHTEPADHSALMPSGSVSSPARGSATPAPAQAPEASRAEAAEDPIDSGSEGESPQHPADLPAWASLWSSKPPCDIDENNSRSQCREVSVTVHFPFDEILPPQRQMIANTVQAALYGKHVVIESPTGTGKTMALLCAALAAQRHFSEHHGAAPKVIYCTRTHQQVKQVVKAARDSPYRPWLQIIGSREQGLCTEGDVLRAAQDEGSKSSQVCRVARRLSEQRSGRARHDPFAPPTCRVWKRLTDRNVVASAHQRMRASASTDGPPAMLDVEDLGRLGTDLNACPYFLSRVALPEAELVVCPYNYVLDPAIAEATDILGNRSIIVIDEGHNLDTHCREAGSVCLSAQTLEHIKQRIDETSRYLTSFHSDEGIDFATLTSMQETIQRVLYLCADTVAAFVQANSSNLAEDRIGCKTWNSTVERPPDVHDFLESCSVMPGFVGAVNQLEQTLHSRGTSGNPRLDGLAAQVLQALTTLKSFADVLELCRSRPADYKVHLEAVRVPTSPSQTVAAATGVNGWSFELHVLLVNPEAVFQNLVESAHCVVIASGTLAPVAGFSAELGDAFAARMLREPLELPHIIGIQQLGVVFIGQSRNRTELRCIRENMAQRAFVQELGQVLLEVVASIPGGVFVFLPSRTFLETALRIWQEPCAGRSSVWESIVEKKGHVAAESRERDGGQALARHEAAVSSSGSAVLFGVYRGRSSEGISLSDAAVRGVICVGIPLPPLDPPVRLKRDYNNAVARAAPPNGRKLDGESWYKLGAHRAVNQAFGRVIRHRHDYGVAVFIDSRWTAKGSYRAVKYLPLWLRQLVKLRDGMFGEDLCFHMDRLIADIRQHFVRNGARGERRSEVSEDAGDGEPLRRVRPRSISQSAGTMAERELGA